MNLLTHNPEKQLSPKAKAFLALAYVLIPVSKIWSAAYALA
jgi:hypothetical protein